jgi:gliding motility-associated-like protein
MTFSEAMIRVTGIFCLILFCSLKTLGQCPVLTLSGASGNACGVSAVTVLGNTFGGSATSVTLTENGGGSVKPASAIVSPFAFTYTPTSADFGKKITITITTNNPTGKPCTAANRTYVLTVNALPSTPTLGTITKPTCTLSTGSVILNSLPSSGVWIIIRKPGDVTTSGTGTTTTISGLESGTYTFTVTNASGCISAASANAIIPAQPTSPPAPQQTVDCSAGIGKAVVNVTSPIGTGLTYNIDGGPYQSSATFPNVANGSHLIRVRNSAGCITAGLTFQITQPAVTIGAITQPTCNVSTGSVVINGLPSTGTWTLIRSPGGVTSTGTGTSTTITNLSTGSYTYVVTNSGSCASNPSAAIVISEQPVIPGVPVIGRIVSPTCALDGSIQITSLPSTGKWTLTRYPGAISTNGSGSEVTISNISAGVYNFTVTNEGACTSGLSGNAVVSAPPWAPSPPLIGSVTQPDLIPTGSVVLNGLPGNGVWTLKRSPDNITMQGSGITVTISGLSPGSYYFSVTNSDQCSSGLSEVVTIETVPVRPTLVINFPPPVCFPETVDLTDPGITTGSSPNLIFTYWTDVSATLPLITPKSANAGTWYIKGTMNGGEYDIEPVKVTVYNAPVANAGSDQIITGQSKAKLDGAPINNNETGLWSVLIGTGEFQDTASPKTTINGLSENRNILLWKVTNGVCSPSIDTVIITIHSHLIPTLITPNMDGKNDYFVIIGFNVSEKIQLMVFDRRGIQVFRNDNYDNKWDGVDMNGKPLINDTYFYLIKTSNNISINGYVLIKR